MKRSSLTVATVFMLTALLWVARVVAGNLSAVPLLALVAQGGPVDVTVSHTSGLQSASPLVPFTTSTQQVLLELASSVVLLALILGLVFWRARRTMLRSRGTDSGLLLYVFVALGVALAMIIAGRSVIEILSSLASRRSLQSDFPGVSLTDALYAVGAVAVGVGVASGVWRLSRLLRRGRQPIAGTQDSGALARQFGSVLDGTVYSLRSGSDLRLAVLKCYKALCDALQEGGASNRPELTAREFEALAVEKLAIRDEHLRRITQLFEKAMYSRDSIEESDARDAEASLLALKGELQQRLLGRGVGL